ncbi:hypothetical protein L1987_79160 [Smallanthus sonchifolius]|uniref:Uncharacterized protein n=1 Tax=Smallanthus sonchifolius TaxID=185202 RepID=A0ACB8ZFQ3_9ASTR|nr:hypothetical protein L1987_79160 [Smallanthus sonchifolius]
MWVITKDEDDFDYDIYRIENSDKVMEVGKNIEVEESRAREDEPEVIDVVFAETFTHLMNHLNCENEDKYREDREDMGVRMIGMVGRIWNKSLLKMKL